MYSSPTGRASHDFGELQLLSSDSVALLYTINPPILIPRLDKNQIAHYLGGVPYFGSPTVSVSGMSPFSHFAEMLSPLVRNLMMDLITPPSSEPL